mgnify:CR=1 FL=1
MIFMDGLVGLFLSGVALPAFFALRIKAGFCSFGFAHSVEFVYSSFLNSRITQKIIFTISGNIAVRIIR